MESGIDFVVVMIGLFAVSEVIDLLATDRDLRPKKTDHKGLPIRLRDIWRIHGSILRGTGIGCIIGVVRGGGAEPGGEIGRAGGRERGWEAVEIVLLVGIFKK